MKKSKKLSLHRETLSALDAARLEQIVGGCTAVHTDCPCDPGAIAARRAIPPC